MKIVALHTDFRIYWPARLRALSNFLKERGSQLEVIEIAGKGSPYSFASHENTHDLRWHILFPNASPEELSGKEIKTKLYKLLDQINPDTILAGAIAFPSGALAVQWVNARKNKRVIIFDDAKIEAVKRDRITNFIKQSVYNGVDAMLYPAEPWISTGLFWNFNKDQLFFGVDVVHNDFWKISEPSNSELNPYIPYFVAVGRQIPKKNFLTIIKAYHEYLIKVGKKNAYHLILVGNGPERERIAQYITQNNLDTHVICMDFLSQTSLRNIYHSADVLILNSNNEETWGLVINEAMCCECAIIASSECGASEVLVKEGINGYITPCDNAPQLTEVLYKFHCLNKDQKDAMKKASVEIISNWGLEKFCHGVYDACQYAHAHNKSNLSLISKLIIKLWHGRYKPV